MAEEGGTSWSATQLIVGFLVILGVLVYLWYQSGGPERADLKGIFLSPPPPIGSGEAYGPGEDLGQESQGPAEVRPQTIE